jgi:hypothetical protein
MIQLAPRKPLPKNIASFKEEVNSAVIKAYFRALDDLSLMYKNELADLVILEKARVHLLFGDYSKIHKLMDEINLEGFCGIGIHSVQIRKVSEIIGWLLFLARKKTG